MFDPPRNKPVLCQALLVFLLLAAGSRAFGQLKADFTVDKPGGCSPLRVAFTSTSTGTSPSTTYAWDFGNGNTSALVNPGATYGAEKTYTVTLTLTDGASTSRQTKQITVYKKPVVNFSSTPQTGCLPVAITFTDSSSPGDGTISSYFWDFGDGNTQQGPGLQQVNHSYDFPQSAVAGLTVFNSYGCYTSVQKPAGTILPALQASFKTDRDFLCNLSDPVTFTNQSTGPGTLSYLWDFGDGNSSNAINPVHVYANKGIYSVSLKVSSSFGCTASSVQQHQINADSFLVDFTYPQILCQNSLDTFTDISTAGALSAQWTVDGVAPNYIVGNNLLYSFVTTGTHQVQLTETYGTCILTLTKNLTVHNVPDIRPFIIIIDSFCALPATVHFRDTTQGAVGWQWNPDNYGSPRATTQAAAYVYTDSRYYYATSTVTNAAGCSATEGQSFYIPPANVSIFIVNDSYPYGCDSVDLVFGAHAIDSIISYSWDFGDGNTSSSAQPRHIFTQRGTFNITLKYVTRRGCSGSTTYSSVQVYNKAVADFSSTLDTVCGNSRSIFVSTSTGDVIATYWNYSSDSGKTYHFGGNNNYQFIQFPDSGTYTIQLIAYSPTGTCNDTLVRKNLVKVLPPIPKINSFTNTCDGTRGLVKFTESSLYAKSWIWDFGDGTSLTLGSKQDTITHTYTKTGYYNVVLTAVNGPCTVKDSLYVPVLVKQNPVLSSPDSVVCASNAMPIQIGNYDFNPDPHFIDVFDANYYYIQSIQYADGSLFTGTYSQVDSQDFFHPWYSTFLGSLINFSHSQTTFRVISTSAYFGCNDTSNYITVKVSGPSAGFKIIDGSPCFDYPVLLEDSSKASPGAPILNWLWSFGDGNTSSQSGPSPQSHAYAAPGLYQIQLKVTDSRGCWDQTAADNRHQINLSGPRASFAYSPAQVTPGTPIQFINNTNTFNSSNTQYRWLFGDGSSSTAFSPSHTYAATGIDTIRLIATNPATGCMDTSIEIIRVQQINTSFTITPAFLSSSSCPPVLVRFSNTSQNALRVSWDFGDGSGADNQPNPSHTYYKPGVYKVIMYGYGYNGTTDTTVDSVIVRAPSAKLKADLLAGCLSQQVTLRAAVSNASSFIWDFADGTLQQTSDSFAVHQYATPGLYTPSLILTDSLGCSLTASLGDTIVIDTLQVGFLNNLQYYCDSALVNFDPLIVSLAADSLHRRLSFSWTFGTGQPSDTSDAPAPSFDFTLPGKYISRLTVRSPYGCVKQATDTVVIVAKSRGAIFGPAELCQGSPATFTATASDPGVHTGWNWTFQNGASSQQQNPPPVIFADSGTFQVRLIVTANGCTDTSRQSLLVHPRPDAKISPADALVCLGKSVQLSSGSPVNSYQWSPAAGLDNAQTPSPLASPVVSTTYHLVVTSPFGCTGADSALVTVASPFQLKVPADTFVCKGSSLRLPVSGANTYSWIGNTDGLSATRSADPVATPLSGTNTYTVVGYDAPGCFTDTANIRVVVHDLPTINHEPGIELMTGSTLTLQASGSSDIITWNWSPPDYLSCTDCAAPVCTPRSEITYIVTGKTQFGCMASDTVLIRLVCAQDHVYIPSVFSPNNDGHNDRFYIRGNGIKSIRSLRVFNRWGQLVFERRNIQAGDAAAGWDGRFKDAPVPTGTYVYTADLECDTGAVFSLKGTLIIIR